MREKAGKNTMIKVTYIVSNIDKALSFEWIAKYLDKDLFLLSFILLNNDTSELGSFLEKNKFETYRLKCSGKKSWPKASYQTYRLLKKIKPDA